MSSFGYNWPNLPYGVNGELNDNLNNRWSDDGSGTTFTFGSEAADRSDRRRWQYGLNATRFQDGWWGGDHSIKSGMVSERESQEFRDEGFLDEVTQAFRTVSPLPNFTTPFRVTIRNTPRQTTNANWHHGAYINDSIQVKNRLTISMGVRWDYYNSFYPEQEIPESRFRDFFYGGVPVQTSVGPYSLPRTTFADNGYIADARSGIKRYPSLIAPRFGMSWDVRGDGKMVFKANWGRFHQNTGNASADVNPLASATATFDWLDLNNDKLFQINESGRTARSPASAASRSASISTSRIPTPTRRASGSSAISATTWASASATRSGPMATFRTTSNSRGFTASTRCRGTSSIPASTASPATPTTARQSRCSTFRVRRRERHRRAHD